MTETVPGPSHPGTVVLDIGTGTGALIVYAPDEMAGQEIDVSPRHQAGAGRTHAVVRERRVAAGGCQAAVYPGLPAGEYTIWRDPRTAAGDVVIRGGEVTQYQWPLAGPGN
jgi:hypothetical protein